MSNQIVDMEITEQCTPPEDDSKPRHLKVKVEERNGAIFITPKGYGDSQNQEPIMLEIWNGEIRVIIWSDVNREDPPHTISLEKANEKLRVEW